MSNDVFDDMKRLKFIEEVLIAFSNNKLIFKDLNDSEHLTFKIREDGILDVHNTVEGSSKEYESLGKFDLTKLLDSEIVKNVQTKLLQMVKVVNFTEPEFVNYFIAIFPTRDDFSQIAKRKKRDVTLGSDDVKNLFGDVFLVPWNEGNDKLKEMGAVYDENVNQIGFVLKISTGFIFLPLQSIEAFAKDFTSFLEQNKK